MNRDPYTTPSVFRPDPAELAAWNAANQRAAAAIGDGPPTYLKSRRVRCACGTQTFNRDGRCSRCRDKGAK